MQRLIAMAMGCLLVSTSLFAETKPSKVATPKAEKGKTTHEAVAATMDVTFENKLVNGKKTWLPNDVKVKEGTKLNLTINNTLDEPHGFEIPGIQPAIVINPHEVKKVTVTVSKKGQYDVRCQMHPAHVGAKLTVE